MDKHHNQPPLAERLALDYAELMERAQDGANQAPADRAPIESDDDAGVYAEDARGLKNIAANIEKARKAEKDQTLKDGRTINAFFASMADPIKATIDKIVGELNRYQRAKLEAERKAAAEREEADRKAAALFDEAPPAPVAPVVVKEAARVTSFSGVKATATVKWVHRVVDPEKVPRQYLMVNDAAIKAAVAGGMRSIDGVEIYEDVRTAIR